MNTFSLEELHQALIVSDTFIYHGAGIAKGVGNTTTNNLSYIQRLRNAINKDLELCCSTIRKGDSEVTFNYWGRIGLILKPKSPNSITQVCPHDAGTIPDQNKICRRQITRYPVTIEEIYESINQRANDSCNEWCVLSYSVFGIYIEPPIQYAEGDELKDIEVASVFNLFPGHKVYVFDNEKNLREILPSSNWSSIVTINEIYK